MGAKAAKSDEWLPKADAARLAGISTRQLERREAQGFVEKMVQPRGPMDRTAPVFYSKTDILALKAGAPNVHARPEPERPARAVPRSEQSTAVAVRPGAAPPVDPFGVITAALARIAPAPLKPWLTLDEAAEWSGLPRSFLVAIAQNAARNRDGAPRLVIDAGTPGRHKWRFNREQLAK